LHTRLAAERLDRFGVKLGASVGPEYHLIVDAEVAVNPSSDPRVLVRVIRGARRPDFLKVHDIVPATVQQFSSNILSGSFFKSSKIKNTNLRLLSANVLINYLI